MENWIYKEILIKEIENLIDEYDIEIDSPDGYQPVSMFVEKGNFIGYECEHIVSGKKIIVNENHLFETKDGWKSTKNLNECEILMDSGEFEKCSVKKLDTIHRIVDIQVEHPNHRYYADGFSSHNTHVGKTAIMIHQAASNLMDGKTVVYFTLEMSEEEISKRIDANMMGLDIDDVLTLSKEQYLKKVNILKSKYTGKLIVKEFPVGQANINHFRHFLNELKLKKNIVPDIVYVDYLNLCNSARMNGNSNANSYTLMKAVSEELRGLAMELNLCIVSASQFNRAGASNSDPEMGDISESFGVAFTADFIAALIATDELKEQDKMLVKQLKNRYDDMNKIPSFFLTYKRAKMKFYDFDGGDFTGGEKSGIKVSSTEKIVNGKFNVEKTKFNNFKL